MTIKSEVDRVMRHASEFRLAPSNQASRDLAYLALSAAILAEDRPSLTGEALNSRAVAQF